MFCEFFRHLDMKAFQVLSVLLLTAAAADAQSFHHGHCPQPSVQEDFNITKYMGTWYEVEKLPAMFERGTCNQATYSLLADGTVSVRNAELLSNRTINSVDGFAKVKDSSQPAILGVSFFKGVPDAPYWVLSTDYLSYAVVYSCSDYFGLFHIDFAWILARSRALPEDLISVLHDKLAAAGVNVNRLTLCPNSAAASFGGPSLRLRRLGPSEDPPSAASTIVKWDGLAFGAFRDCVTTS